MRYGRAKAARRTLAFFARTVGLTATPYHMLLDGTFLVSACKSKLTASQVHDRLARLVHQGGTHQHVDFCVTQSTLDELQRLEATSEQHKVLFQEAQGVARELCRVLQHAPPPTGGRRAPRKLSHVSRDLWRWVCAAGTTLQETKDNQEDSSVIPTFLVATQDDDLLEALRAAGTCPIVRWASHSGSVLLLESPSKAAQAQARSDQRTQATAMTDAERTLATLARQEVRKQQQQATTSTTARNPLGRSSTTTTSRKPKKAKGPNPLSCKKKQPPTTTEAEQPAKKKRRKRQKEATTAQQE